MKTRKPPRLTLTAAAQAAGVDRLTLERRLADAREKPDTAGKYGIGQVVRSLTNGLQAARLRHAEAAAEREVLALQREQGAVVEIAAVRAKWTEVISEMRAVVLASNLPKVDRHRLIDLLREIPAGRYSEDPAAPAAETDTES